MSTAAVVLFFGGWQPPNTLLEKFLLFLGFPCIFPIIIMLFLLVVDIQNLSDITVSTLSFNVFFHFLYLPGNIMFVIKVFLMIWLFLLARAALPRLRYDQLMRLGWKVILPLSLASTIITASLLEITGCFPPIKP